MRNARLLVVEDDPHMREALNEVLNRGLVKEVLLAGDGEEGLEMVKAHSPDVIISDLKMPRMDGLTFYKKAKGITGAPVIFITAYGTVPIAVDAMREGAFDFILKPFSMDILEEAVGRAIRYASAKRGKPTVTRQSRGVRFLGESPAILEIKRLSERVAASKSTVLITGESGTGKEVVARYIHQLSPRGQKPFVAVNCAAIPDTLLESELFGYEKGAFTGAVAQKPGKFELAHKGTILLDEISEMSPVLQAKLLRVIQEEEVERIGGKGPVKLDVRIIATTNRDLDEMVEKGDFREDLYYRLNVIPMVLPPLRERVDDIDLLARFFLEKYSEENQRSFNGFTDGAMEMLKSYHWPGNVRELENVVERAVVIAGDKTLLDTQDIFLKGRKGREKKAGSGITAGMTVKDMEKALILKTLEEVKGNRTRAAELLGITTRTLRNKLSEYRAEGERFGWEDE